MKTKNPFQPADPIDRKVKLLLFGDWGTGKTHAALTFPRVAMIDSEGGSTFFRGRADVPPFQVLNTKSMSDLEEAIAFIVDDNGRTFDTLVIDPVSVIYKVTRQALADANKKNPGDMGYREWGKLNSKMNSLYTRLINLPVHVVMIARETTEYEGTGDSLRKVGVKPDSDKDIGYLFDIVLHMQEDHSGIVIKSRTPQLRKGQTMKTVSWDMFAPIVANPVGKRETLPEEGATSEREALRDEFQDRATVESFVSHWTERGASVKDITSALKVDKLSQWTLGTLAAHQAVRAYLGIESNITPLPDTAAS